MKDLLPISRLQLMFLMAAANLSVVGSFAGIFMGLSWRGMAGALVFFLIGLAAAFQFNAGKALNADSVNPARAAREFFLSSTLTVIYFVTVRLLVGML